MKNFITAFLVFLIWSFFGLWFYSWLKPNHSTPVASIQLENTNKKGTPESSNKTGVELVASEEKKVANSKDSSFNILNEDNDIIYSFSEGITIYENKAQIYIPEIDSNFKSTLKEYFIANPNKELHVLSFYSANENFGTPNFGAQRGNKLKEVLTAEGFLPNKIVVKPMIKEIDFNAEGNYKNGIQFIVKLLDFDRLNTLKNTIPKSLIVYPLYSGSDLLTSTELRNAAENIKNIIQENPSMSIEVIGHTDNIGNSTDNYRVGLENARQIRAYIINTTGIDRKKIKASSQGESSPLNDNNSETGRETNRRIEIVFHQ